MKPQLCSSINQSEVDELIQNDYWVAEQKLDGNRLLISVKEGTASLYGRNGQPYSKKVPSELIAGLESLGVDLTLDGELVGEEYYVFDLPFWELDLRMSEFVARRLTLELVSPHFAGLPIVLVRQASTRSEKSKLLKAVKKASGEGVVFKHQMAPYLDGKRSEKCVKVKFFDTADVVVTGIRTNGKNSVDVSLYDQGTLVPFGSVTMKKSDLAQIRVNDVIEIKYLYVGAGNRFYQPNFLTFRDDKSAEECTVDQNLKRVNKAAL